MATAPPAVLDPTQFYYPIPPPSIPPAPPSSKSSNSSVLEMMKIIVGLLIALILGGILAAFLFLPRDNQPIDLRESNEKISRLEREQQSLLQSEQQKHVEKMAEEKRMIDQMTRKQHQEFELFLTLERARREQEMQQKHFDVLLQGQRQVEQYQKEQHGRENEEVLEKFIEEVSMMSQPLNVYRIQMRVLSLLRRLEHEQKSSLIIFLYKFNLLSSSPLDLQGANLKDLKLNDVGQDLADRKCNSADRLKLIFSENHFSGYSCKLLPSLSSRNKFNQCIVRENLS